MRATRHLNRFWFRSSLAISPLIVSIWVLSGFGQFMYGCVYLAHGDAAIIWPRGVIPFQTQVEYFYLSADWKPVYIRIPLPDRHVLPPPLDREPSEAQVRQYIAQWLRAEVVIPKPGGMIWLPLLPFVLIAVSVNVAMLCLMYRNRGKDDGCTSCGYSLTGNTSGVCPECGEVVLGQAADANRTEPPMKKSEQG